MARPIGSERFLKSGLLISGRPGVDHVASHVGHVASLLPHYRGHGVHVGHVAGRCVHVAHVARRVCESVEPPPCSMLALQCVHHVHVLRAVRNIGVDLCADRGSWGDSVFFCGRGRPDGAGEVWARRRGTSF